MVGGSEEGVGTHPEWMVHPFARFTETKSKYLTACDEREWGVGWGKNLALLPHPCANPC